MLVRGQLVPHVTVRRTDGEAFAYETIWQRRALLLVVLPDASRPHESDDVVRYAGAIAAAHEDIDAHDAEVVVTRDSVAGLPAPGVLIADRWGEIIAVYAVDTVTKLPPVSDLLDWLRFVGYACPECEGEVK